MEDKKIHLIDILEILVSWRKKIFINTFVVGIVALVISLLLPKWYKAEAIVLPPSRDGFSLGLGAIGELAGSFLGPTGFELPMLATRADVYNTIVQSRRVLESVIQQNDLLAIYKTKNMDKAIKKMRSLLKTEVGHDGSLLISYEAQKDPKLAAQVTNSFLKELDKVNTETSQSKARGTRIFVEQRLDETKKNLANAEEALRQFQEQHSTISIEEQTKATIEGAAKLAAEMMALKIQLGVMQSQLSASHSEIKDLTLRINEMDRMLRDIKTGSTQKQHNPANLSEESSLYIPLDKVPNLGLQLARLFREVKIQEILFELLTQQYEQAKIREMEDTPTIQVLEYAVPPLLKSRPKRALIIGVSMAFALLMSVFFAFVIEYFQKSKEQNTEEYTRFERIGREILADIRLLRRPRI